MNINRVVLTGNLTRQPQLRKSQAGTSVLPMRLACTTRKKDTNGEWQDCPNYFDITAFGVVADNCSTYLTKGRGIAVDGRLVWKEWETDSGERRQSVQIVADQIQFLSNGQNHKSDTQGVPEEHEQSLTAADIPF